MYMHMYVLMFVCIRVFGLIFDLGQRHVYASSMKGTPLVLHP
jgi:hypothetical protein